MEQRVIAGTSVLGRAGDLAPGNGFTGVLHEVVPFDPLHYPDWDSLLTGKTESSFFHTSAWARVLHETYGHKPFYFCRMGSGHLQGLLAVMEVSSLWTGLRGVSLPFTDYCPVISGEVDSAEALYQAAMECGHRRGWRYLESRYGGNGWPGSTPSLGFYNHVVQLDQGPEMLWKQLDDGLRRGIRKAERSGLQVDFNESLQAMKEFYFLHCLTRQRHGVPPQPFRFFNNIVRHVLSKGQGFIATARFGQRPVAAAVFFHHGRESIYKFGASDFSLQQLRANNLMMWTAIKRLASQGFATLDMGRTSLTNEGLRRFKLAFGASEKKLNYFKYSFGQGGFVMDEDRAATWANHIFRHLPLSVLRFAGRALYPHFS